MSAFAATLTGIDAPLGTPSSIISVTDSIRDSDGICGVCSPFDDSPSAELGCDGADYFGINECSHCDDDLLYHDQRLLRSVAQKLSLMNSYSTDLRPISVRTVTHYLRTIKLSLDGVALAYNILANYQGDEIHLKRNDSAGSLQTCQEPSLTALSPRSELVLLAALRIAMAYLEDRKAPTSWWVTTATKNAFRQWEVRAATRSVYEAVGWKLSLFAASEARTSALASLSSNANARKTAKPKPQLMISTPVASNPPTSLGRKMSLRELVTPFTAFFHDHGDSALQTAKSA